MRFRTLATMMVVLGVHGRQATHAGAQAPDSWNAERTRQLVENAVARRARQLADTGLADYHATAHGYVTFLAQLGHGLLESPTIVKADELALEVYWRAPDFSKQVIVGRRDTLALPTDITYHRDHLGIVQNNFPDVIRIGEGDEVRDVPHPLSPGGLDAYDFAVGDSLRIRTPQRTIDVWELRVRPKDDRLPRIVGSLFLDRGTAQVVRMAFSFTRAAFLEAGLEDISVVVENSLVEGRFWLPSRQEVEIRRTGSWLDFPARGIIRGRWEIGDYALNVGTAPGFYNGAEIVQLPDDRLRRYPFPGRILDGLPPDVRAVADADVRRVQEEARRLVRGEAIARARATSLAAGRVSDFVRADRVEGIAVGAGVSRTFGRGLAATASGRWGFDDHAAKGRVVLSARAASGRDLSVFASRDFRNIGDEPEASSVVSSIAAQEFASDRADPFDVRATGAALLLAERAGARVRLEASYETHDPLSVHAVPATGTFAPTIPARRLHGLGVGIAVERPPALGWGGTEVRVDAAVRGLRYWPRDAAAPAVGTLGRVWLGVAVERPFGRRRLLTRVTGAAVSNAAGLPPEELVYLGGPVSAPGYDFHSLVGRLGATAHAEWRTPIPFVPIPLGRFGTAPPTATLAPYAHLAALAEAAAGGAGARPAVGVACLAVFDLLRVDVARGLRGGRWTFSLDVTRDFWSAL